MLNGSCLSALIKEYSALSDNSSRLSFTLNGKVRGSIAKTDCSYSLVSKFIQNIVRRGFTPNLKLGPDAVIFINPSVSILIIGCQILKPIPTLCAKQFTSISSSVLWYSTLSRDLMMS